MFFAEPVATATALAVPPRLASWDAAQTKSQMLLREYLDATTSVVEHSAAGIDGPLAVKLVVALPTHLPLTKGGRDLDNYALPLISGIGHRRVAAMFVEKVHSHQSTITVASAKPGRPPDATWSSFATTTTSSTDRPEWKAELAAAAPSSALEGEGGVEMHVAYSVAPGRNWSALWKPTLDALGGVLGVQDPSRPFHPRDDRIMRLGLHRTLDTSLGWGVRLSVWWRPVDGSPAA